MDPKSFTRSAPGRIVRTADGHPAFVPNPLPPPLELNWPLMQAISESERAVGTLSGSAQLLPNPHILIQPFARREAVLSSRIEGTQASLSDLVLYEAGGTTDLEHSDVREVSNYLVALEHGILRLPELPLSLRLIREMHEKLMVGVRGGPPAPGEFRRVQNWIGTGGSTMRDATYVPPPVAEMHRALDAFERYLHEPPTLPILVRSAIIHYQFEAIHPFLDGNGRIGRLLTILLLHAEKVLEQPLLYLSAFFEKHRDEYYARLLAVSTRGAWGEWIGFFLRGVIEQANDAVARTRELLDLASEYRERVSSARNAGVMLELLDDLFRLPATTIPSIARRYTMSYPAAQKNVEKLVRKGILTPVKSGRMTVFLAPEINAVVERA